MAKTVADVLKMGKDVKMVDIRFIDLPGTWQHFTIPALASMKTSSRKAWRSMAHPSAALRKSMNRICSSCPIPNSAFVDPVAEIPTLVLICDVL